MWLRWFVPVLMFCSEHVQANDITAGKQATNIALPQDMNSGNSSVIKSDISKHTSPTLSTDSFNQNVVTTIALGNTKPNTLNLQEKNKTVDLPTSNMDVNGTFNNSRIAIVPNESTTEMTIKYGDKIINSSTVQIDTNFTTMGKNSDLLINITEAYNISDEREFKNLSNSNHSFHIYSTDVVELTLTKIKYRFDVQSFFGGICVGIVILFFGYLGKKYYKLYYSQRNIYRSFTYYPEEQDTMLLD